MIITRTILFIFAMLAIVAQAETYPSKPIRVVVPYPPGGTPDILIRELGPKLTAALGQQIIVENRPGAGGNIGSEVVAKAAPDGYTLVMGTTATHSINQALYKKLAYDPVKDFVAVALIATMPNVLVVNNDFPVKNVKELIALAKAKPGTITFGSGGNGTTHHLSGALFEKMTGVDMTHVPYKGAGQALPDLIGGQINIMFDNITSSMAYIKSGKLRVLAVTTPKRSAALPDVPTMQEAGVPGYEMSGWFGLLAPAKTPPEIVARLNKAINKILQSIEMKELLAKQGAEIVISTPAEFTAFVKERTDKMTKVVKDSGAQID